MHITFGWGFDNARWTDTTPATLGSVVTGPDTLTDILATRLALTRPALDQPRRIAAYEAALDQVVGDLPDGVWPAAGFATDPWTVARELLRWRDILVAAGWTVSDSGSITVPHRLRVLTRVEALLPTTDGWTPGPADTLRDVDATLAELDADGIRWPLGITTINVDHRVSDLPPVWRRILGHLAALGVTVTELPAPAPIEKLTVRTADSEWDAVPGTARLLTDLEAESRRHSVVAGSSTDLLDRELLRIGGTPLGVQPAGVRPLSQVITLFLRAVTAPYNVTALADLLNASIPAPGGAPRPVLPLHLRRSLADALGQQPGVGGDAWHSAVRLATEHYDTDLDAGQITATDADRERLAVTEFDRLIRDTPLTDDDGYSTALVATHLDWLLSRFLGNTRGRNGAAPAVEQIREIRSLVISLAERISPRELEQIITEVTETGHLRTCAEASACRDVVTSPAQLGTGTAPVLWWLPVDDTPATGHRIRPTEQDWLDAAGVEFADPEDLARLSLESELRALRRRREVTAVLPTLVHSEKVSEHPALTFLLNDLPRSKKTTFTELRKSVTSPASLETLAPPSGITEPPQRPLVSPDPVERTFTPDEELIPTMISYSQWEKLLIHPLEWFLERRLGISAGTLATVPTGNQMIGTWLHAVVENIVNRHLTASGGAPVIIETTADAVSDELEELLPAYASELDLPGARRRRGSVLALAATAITGLFTTLSDAGIRIRSVESDFSTPLEGSHGRHGTPLDLRGFRDMDVVMADGTAGVIDLKYTFSKKKYRQAVENGTALQLAVYAASVAEPATPLDDVPVAYFSLRDNHLHTADPRFGLADETLTVIPADGGAATTDLLWERALDSLNRILDNLRAGTVTDLGNLLQEQELWPDEELSPEATAALARERENGFLPEASARYTDFPLITGLEGDRA